MRLAQGQDVSDSFYTSSINLHLGLWSGCLSYEMLTPSWQMGKRAYHNKSFLHQLARAVNVPVGRRSGGRLAMILVATINDIIFSFLFFFFLFPSSTFLIEGVLGSKNLLSESCLECPKTVGHFGAPWRPYWILQTVRHCSR